MIIEIKLGPDLTLAFEEPANDMGIGITASITAMPVLDDIANQLYFKVDTGPKLRCRTGNGNYPEDMPNRNKADNHVSWRLAQHEARLWQIGGQPYLGIDHPDYQYEIELTAEQSEIFSKRFP
jgi:hypothetical protein